MELVGGGSVINGLPHLFSLANQIIYIVGNICDLLIHFTKNKWGKIWRTKNLQFNFFIGWGPPCGLCDSSIWLEERFSSYILHAWLLWMIVMIGYFRGMSTTQWKAQQPTWKIMFFKQMLPLLLRNIFATQILSLYQFLIYWPIMDLTKAEFGLVFFWLVCVKQVVWQIFFKCVPSTKYFVIGHMCQTWYDCCTELTQSAQVSKY